MMTRRGTVLSCGILLLIGTHCASGPELSEGARDFAHWAEERAQPLESTALEAESSDLAGLGAIVGDATVVAVGESTHRVHEQLEVRARLLAYLVENHDFRLLAAETSMPHAERINEYVLGGPGDVRELLRGSGTWPLMNNEETLAIVEWVRSFNARPDTTTKVQFFGLDITTPEPALDSVQAYLESVDPDALTTLSASFDSLRGLLSQTGAQTYQALLDRYDEAASSDLATLSTDLASLLDQLEQQAPAYVAASSQGAYDRALRSAKVLARGHEYFAVQVSAGAPGSAERIVAASQVRDPAMADNALWILEQNPEQSMVLWAHNLHISRDGQNQVFRVGDDLEVKALTSMGSVLDTTLGSSMVVMFGSLLAGESGDYGELPDLIDDTVDGALGLVGPEMFYLDVRGVPDDRAGGVWMGEAHPMRAEIGMVTSTPSKAFDAVYFVASGSPAQDLE